MTRYRVYNSQTCVTLWKGAAADEQAALDAAARDAGYGDYASVPDEARSPFIVVGNLDHEAECLDKRTTIDAAKARFAAKRC